MESLILNIISNSKNSKLLLKEVYEHLSGDKSVNYKQIRGAVRQLVKDGKISSSLVKGDHYGVTELSITTATINVHTIETDLRNSQIREFGVFDSYSKSAKNEMIQKQLRAELESLRENEYATIIKDSGGEIVYTMSHWNVKDEDTKTQIKIYEGE